MSENNEKNIKKAEESQDASEEKKEELTVEQKLFISRTQKTKKEIP